MEDINITLIGKITLSNEDIEFSPVYNNCCIVNDKFLLISSQCVYIKNQIIKKEEKEDEEYKEEKEDKEVKDDIEDKNKEINKIKKAGGIYLISLEKLEIIQFFTIGKCRFVNSCLFYKNNIFICNFAQYKYRKEKKKRTIYKLLLFQLIDNKNGKKKMINKCFLPGEYALINSSSMLLDNFFISSHGKSNSLVKVIEDEKFGKIGNIEIKKEK